MNKLTCPQQIAIAAMIVIVAGLCCLAANLYIESIDLSSLPTRIPTIAPAPTITAPPTPIKFDEAGAIVMCRRFIRGKLKVPSSAKFSDETTFRRSGKPANYAAVTGAVQSQNAFGVVLSSKYQCDVHYIPGDGNRWVLDNLRFE